MLQRAASNAYSWWWASHIRTKQSKWLEQNLQDMEEKVASTLKLIEEDGDSFAKRAEMYYKKRPELIFFVEEFYRAYRALAERYDHLSTELQNANNTIASVCPDRVPFFMDDDDDDVTPRSGRKPKEIPKTNGPQVPSAPIKDLKHLITSAATKKKSQPKKLSYKPVYAKDPPKSGFEKTEALGEIDKLQKQILTLQTEKEFVKSSYESGLAKYWEIEKKIMEQQEKTSGLHDEFGEGTVIEDDEARTLMAATALKSCQEALAQLQEKHERSVEEASAEKLRIKKTSEKFESLKLEFLHTGPQKMVTTSNEEARGDDAHEKELGTLREKIKERFEVGPNASLTVSELAEKIDEIVGTVINLETAVSSPSALIHRLKTETDDLQAQIRTLEDDKEKMIHGKNSLSDKLREMEKRLNELQDLNRSIEEQNNKLQILFTEASCNLDHLSDKLREGEPDEEIDGKSASQIEDKSEKEIRKTGDALILNNDLDELQRLKPDETEASCLAQKEHESPSDVKSVNEVQKKQEEKPNIPGVIENDLDVKSHNFSNSNRNQGDLRQANAIRKSDNLPENEVSSLTLGSVLNIDPEQEEKQKQEADEPDWKQLYMNGMEEEKKIYW